MTEAQAERMVVALERIAAALTAPMSDAAPVCVHPVEARSDESTMGYPGRFHCDPARGGCGHRNYTE